MPAKLKLEFDRFGGVPMAQIGIASHHGNLSEHRVLLTCHCKDYGEFQAELKALRGELDRVEADAIELFMQTKRLTTF